MMFSKTSVLPIAAIFVASVAARPVSNSTIATEGPYSAAGTLDANQYDIKIAEEAVAEAAVNIGDILREYHTYRTVMTGNSTISVPYHAANASGLPANTNSSLEKREPLFPTHLCLRIRCDSNGLPHRQGPHYVDFTRIPERLLLNATAKRSLPPVPVPSYPLVPELMLAANATSNSTVQRINNFVIDEIKGELSDMTDGFMQASWGVESNLLDSSDRVNHDEAEQLKHDMIAVVAVAQGAVKTVRDIEKNTKINLQQQLGSELNPLEVAVGRLWEPLNAYAIKVGSAGKTSQNPQLEQVLSLAQQGSKRIWELMELLRS